jgi:hypothetical protein
MKINIDKIERWDVIELPNGKKYEILDFTKLRDYYIVATMEEPMELNALEIRKTKDGKMQTREYRGEDYPELLAELLEITDLVKPAELIEFLKTPIPVEVVEEILESLNQTDQPPQARGNGGDMEMMWAVGDAGDGGEARKGT